MGSPAEPSSSPRSKDLSCDSLQQDFIETQKALLHQKPVPDEPNDKITSDNLLYNIVWRFLTGKMPLDPFAGLFLTYVSVVKLYLDGDLMVF